MCKERDTNGNTERTFEIVSYILTADNRLEMGVNDVNFLADRKHQDIPPKSRLRDVCLFR